MQTDSTTERWTGHNGAIYDVAFDERHGGWLSAGGDGLIVRWSDSGQGQAIMHHNEAFFSVSSAAGEVAAGTAGGELFLKPAHGETARIPLHAAGLFSLLRMDSEWLTGGGSGQIRLAHSPPLPPLSEAPGKIRCFVPGPDGSVFVGTSGGNGHLLNLSTGIASPPIAHHEGGLYCAHYLDTKGTWITGGRDGHLRVWKASGELVWSFPAHAGSIYRLIAVGNHLWTASRDKSIKGWRLSDLGMQFKIGPGAHAHTRSVNALGGRLLEDGQTELVSGGDDRIVLRHRIRTN